MSGSKVTFPSRIAACKMGEYVSKSSGRSYLVGFMGGIKVVAIADPSAEPMKGAMQNWNLYFEPAPPRKEK